MLPLLQAGGYPYSMAGGSSGGGAQRSSGGGGRPPQQPGQKKRRSLMLHIFDLIRCGLVRGGDGGPGGSIAVFGRGGQLALLSNEACVTRPPRPVPAPPAGASATR